MYQYTKRVAIDSIKTNQHSIKMLGPDFVIIRIYMYMYSRASIIIQTVQFSATNFIIVTYFVEKERTEY